MVIKVTQDEKRSFQRTAVYIIAIFFLNRIISVPMISGNETIGNVYTLISQAITLWYTLKFLVFHAREKRLLLSDVGIIVLTVIFFLYLIFASWFENGYIRRAIFSAYPIIGTMCFVEIESRISPRELLHAFSFFSYLFAVFNLIDIVILRISGNFSVNTPFLVGGKNQLAVFLCIALSFYLGYNEMMAEDFGKRIGTKNLIFFVIVLLNSMLSLSGTCIITVGIVTVLYIVYRIRGGQSFILAPLNVLIIYVIAWFALIIFRLQYLFADLIQNVLHKDLTLSHRTIIWDKALELIYKKPIFGHGLAESYNVFSVYHDYTGGNNSVWTSMSGHNEILQLLYYGGIVLIVILLIMYLTACREFRRHNYFFVFMFIAVVGILINWMSEVPGEYSLFLMLAMCYWSYRFDPEYVESLQHGF